MKIEFTKMHGIGNDYIYVNCLQGELPDPAGAAKRMSPRHFSVGADGLVMICASQVADAKMRMFNADGSEGKMCGNAIRCVGKYLYDNGLTNKTELTIETLSGIKQLRLHVSGDTVDTVSVDMGPAVFDPAQIPVAAETPVVDSLFTIGGTEYRMTCVSMGNPHAVVYVEDVDSLPLEEIGPLFENHPMFPDRVNTEFIQRLDCGALKMRVWERGSGETWACGTGACAAVAASVKNGYCGSGVAVTVHLIGGDLQIVCGEDFAVNMTGKAEKSYDGVFEYED